MQRNPLVSVVLPCYNYGRFVGEAIQSILDQTFGDFELIVVDDGSTDDTPEVLSRFTDGRMRVIRRPNGGCAAARNTGRSLARGEFLAFLDADDLWRPTYLERQMEVFQAEPDVDFCFANMVRTENGEVLQTQFDLVPRLREIPARPSRVPGAYVLQMDTFSALTPAPDPPGWLQASVMKLSAIKDAYSKPGIPNAEDLYLILQIYSLTRAAFIDEPLVEIRRHGRNSYRSDDKIRTAVLSVLRQVHDEVKLSDGHREILQRRIGAEYCRRGWRFFWNHDIGKAARHYAEALMWPGSRLNALVHLAALPVVPLLPRRHSGFEDRPVPS